MRSLCWPPDYFYTALMDPLLALTLDTATLLKWGGAGLVLAVYVLFKFAGPKALALIGKTKTSKPVEGLTTPVVIPAVNVAHNYQETLERYDDIIEAGVAVGLDDADIAMIQDIRARFQLLAVSHPSSPLPTT